MIQMTEKQPEEVYENNWVGRIVGVKRMEELSEEVGVKESHEEAGEEPAKVGWIHGKND